MRRLIRAIFRAEAALAFGVGSTCAAVANTADTLGAWSDRWFDAASSRVKAREENSPVRVG